MSSNFFWLMAAVALAPFNINGMAVFRTEMLRIEVLEIKERTQRGIAEFDSQRLDDTVRKSLIAKFLEVQETQIVDLLEKVESERHEAFLDVQGLAVSECLKRDITKYTHLVHYIICQAGNALSNRTKLKYLVSFDSQKLRKEVIKDMIERENINPNDINPDCSPLYESVLLKDTGYTVYLLAYGAKPNQHILEAAQRTPGIMALLSGIPHE